jgi:glycosyltransferase involved in cell wall biosynthesis
LYDAHELETERNGWSWPIRRFAKIIESRLISACDHTIVVSDSIQGWYESTYPGLKVSTVRNVTNIPKMVGESRLRGTLDVPPDAILFVYCGVLSDGRGLQELVAAFQDLGPDRHLVLVGSGPLRESLSAQITDLSNVHLHDRVPQSELITLISGADVGVMVPSTVALSYRFAMPNKVFEYAAAGLAICVGTGPDLQRFAAAYPAACTAELSVAALKEMALSWSRQRLTQLRPLIKAYRPPSWDEEKLRLIEAYQAAMGQTNRP